MHKITGRAVPFWKSIVGCEITTFFKMKNRLCVRSLHILERRTHVDVAQSLTENEKSHVENLYKGLVNKRLRHCLAQSITLVESAHPRKQLQAQYLLSLVLEHQKALELEKDMESYSFRIGLSGPPGAGKSTFLESMGKRLTGKGHKVAVLAVDPSSSTTGGSLLGDKTRMPELTRDMNAFIRPSPAGGHIGGVTRSTNEAIVMCEGAGFDTIFIETVGVGQSEYEVADMVDLFVLLIPPAGGDELQGLKRGIVERCHLVVVNKSDGDLKPAAMRISAEYTSALKFMRPISKNWRPEVKRVSSVTGEGIDDLWKTMLDFRETMISTGELKKTRKKQQKIWMWHQINAHIMSVFRNHPSVKSKISLLEAEVEEGIVTPGYAADLLLQEFLK